MMSYLTMAIEAIDEEIALYEDKVRRLKIAKAEIAGLTNGAVEKESVEQRSQTQDESEEKEGEEDDSGDEEDAHHPHPPPERSSPAKRGRVKIKQFKGSKAARGQRGGKKREGSQVEKDLLAVKAVLQRNSDRWFSANDLRAEAMRNGSPVSEKTVFQANCGKYLPGQPWCKVQLEGRRKFYTLGRGYGGKAPQMPLSGYKPSEG